MNEEQNAISLRVIETMQKALAKYAAEGLNDGITPKDTQIIIALRPDLDSGNMVPYYRVWKKMQPYLRARKIKEHPGSENTDEVSFKNILGVKLDFRGIEETAKVFLVDTFARMQKEITEGVQKAQNNPDFAAEFGFYEDENQPKSYKPVLEIFITTASDNPVRPVPLLYYEGHQIRQLDFTKDIFLMPT